MSALISARDNIKCNNNNNNNNNNKKKKKNNHDNKKTNYNKLKRKRKILS